MPTSDAVGTPRRVCLILGSVIAVVGFAQLGLTVALFTFLAAFNDLYNSESPQCCHIAHRSGLEYLLSPPLNVKALWVLPIVVGVGGVLLSRLRRPLIAQLAVGMAATGVLVAGIVTLDLGGVNAPSVQDLISPLSILSVVLVPLCVTLAVVATRVRRRGRESSALPGEPDERPQHAAG
jgi:hypothetical protein